MFTLKQLAAYEGPNCPFCTEDGNTVSGGPFDCDERAAWQKVTCDACGKSWQDIYHRDAIADMEADDYEQQHLPGKTNIDLSKVDWKLLREQKAWLAETSLQHVSAEGKKSWHPQAEGLLSLLDHLMDEAAKTLGEKLVFGK